MHSNREGQSASSDEIVSTVNKTVERDARYTVHDIA